MKSSRIPWKIDFIIFGFFLSLYVLIGRGEYYSIDEMARYGLTKTLVLERDLSITKADGTSFYCAYPILQSIIAVPLYVLGEFAVGGDPVAREEGGRLLVSFLNSILTALSCVVLFRISRHVKHRLRTSLILTLVFGLCTITLPYARMFLSEPLTGLLLLCAAFFAISSSRERPLRGILAGFFLFVAATNNYVALPAMGIVFLYFAFQVKGIRESLRFDTLKDVRLWALILFGMAAVAEGLWYNQARFGSYFKSAYHFYEIQPNIVYPDGMTGFSYPLLAGIYGFLLSPTRSIFLFSPPLIAAFFVWPRFLREHRRTAFLFLSVSAVFLLIYSKWFGWHGGYAWGPRYMVQVTGFLLIPFGYLIEDFQNLARLKKLSVTALCIAGFYVQLLPTILHPVESYVKILEDYGGLYNELMILFLPQACSVVVQTKLLKTITSLADTDLYFLKHLDSGAHLLAMGVFAALLLVTAILYFRAMRRSADDSDAEY